MTNIMHIPTLPNDAEVGDIKLRNSDDGHIIKSGEVIEMTTSDPKQRPLPDWDLLEMQWVLQRLTALKGAADIPDSVLSESEDLTDSDLMEHDAISDKGQCERGKQDTDEDWLDRINHWIDDQPTLTSV